jgi:hypothetical protein
MSHDHLISLPVPVDQYIHNFYAEHPKGKLNFDASHSVEGARYFLVPLSDTVTQLQTLDYSGVHILHNAVDTCRQLFRGGLHLDRFNQLNHLIDTEITGDPLFSDENFLDGLEFVLQRVGRGSGFRVMLTNNPMGMQILIGSRFMPYRKRSEESAEFGQELYDPVAGTHLKIQIQPRILNHYTDAQIQVLFENIANYFLISTIEHYDSTDNSAHDLVWKYLKCEIHLCVDLQGWTPKIDILQSILCRTSELRLDDNPEKLDFKHHAVVFGKSFETLTLGDRATHQLSIYRKDLRVIKEGVLDYWQNLWKSKCPAYNPDLPVWRVELRFHSSVVSLLAPAMIEARIAENFLTPDTQQYDAQTMENLEVRFPQDFGLHSFFQVKNYLPSFWRYGLAKLYRLVYDYPNGVTDYHPIWSILIREVEWKGQYVDFKRFKKTIDQRDPEKTEARNVQFALGNMIAIHARNLLDSCSTTQSIIEDLDYVVTDFLKSLQNVTSFYNALSSLYQRRSRKYWWENLIEHVTKLFKKRVLLSNAFC